MNNQRIVEINSKFCKIYRYIKTVSIKCNKTRAALSTLIKHRWRTTFSKEHIEEKKKECSFLSVLRIESARDVSSRRNVE